MKTNISRVPYKKGGDMTKDKVKWWSWDEICNRCGKVVHKKDDFIASKPDTEEKDYCLDCLRVLIDEKLKGD